jgi:MtN3 and saliva related transmembrane protein
MILDKIMNNYIGYIAGTFTAFAFIPQVYKVFKTKHTKALSFATLVIFLIGQILWITHGVFTKDNSIIIFSAITLILYIMLIYAKIKF